MTGERNDFELSLQIKAANESNKIAGDPTSDYGSLIQRATTSCDSTSQCNGPTILLYDQGKIEFRLRGGDALIVPSGVSSWTEWVDLRFTLNAADKMLKIFVNGQEKGSHQLAKWDDYLADQSTFTNTYLRLGAHWDPDNTDFQNLNADIRNLLITGQTNVEKPAVPLDVSQKREVNDYAGLADSVAAGTTVLHVKDASAFSPGDQIMVIQMQQDPRLTEVLVGTYEFKTVESISNNRISVDSGLINSYYQSESSKAQIVRVPKFTDITVNSGGLLTAAPWDGNQAGILALTASGSVTVEPGGRIDVSGLGFRGAPRHNNPGGWTDGYRGEGHTGGYDSQETITHATGGGGGIAGWSGFENAGGGGGGGNFTSGYEGDSYSPNTMGSSNSGMGQGGLSWANTSIPITGVNANLKYAGSAAVGDKVYFAPFNATEVGVLDISNTSQTSQGTFSTIPLTPDVTGQYKFFGAVSVQDKVYFAPYHATEVGILDTSDTSPQYPHGTFSTIQLPADVTSPWKYRGASAVGDKVYFTPYGATEVGVLDTTTETFDTIPMTGVDTLWKYHGATTVGDKVYFAPYGATKVGLLDTSDTSNGSLPHGTFSTIDTVLTGIDAERKYHDAATVGDKVYFAPWDATKVGVLDTTTTTFSTIPLPAGVTGTAKYSGASAVGDKGLFCTFQRYRSGHPGYQRHVGRIITPRHLLDGPAIR